MTNWIDDLLSPRGEELLAFLASAAITPANEIALISRLREEYPVNLVNAALTQRRLRKKARAKFQRADHMFFTEAGLEQASSERMAANHARRYEPFARIADLCSGIGGDLIALAAERDVRAVDRDSTHLRIAALNANAYAARGTVELVCADVREVRLDGINAAFIDPARRAEGQRLAASSSEPPLEWCYELARTVPLGVKAGPALPMTLVPAGWEVEFVSEGRELKEALLWSPALATTARRATLLPAGVTLIEQPGCRIEVKQPGAYLIDPDPAVTRAGLVKELAQLVSAWKIDPQIAFLSSHAPVRTPFGRTLQVSASLPWNLKQLRSKLRDLDIGSVDIRKRGSAVDVDEIQRRLKLQGEGSATVVLTRVADRPWMFVCVDPRD